MCIPSVQDEFSAATSDGRIQVEYKQGFDDPLAVFYQHLEPGLKVKFGEKLQSDACSLQGILFVAH